MQVLSALWEDDLLALVRATERELLVVSPYLTERAAGRVLSVLKSRDVRPKVLTDLSPRILVQGTQSSAIRSLAERGEIYHLAGLHAKVFVSDSREAIVTSGNLTDGGLRTNFEMGILVQDPAAVAQIRAEVHRYLHTARRLEPADLSPYLNEVEQLQRQDAIPKLPTSLLEAFERVMPRSASSRRRGEHPADRHVPVRETFRATILAELHVNGPQPVERLYEVTASRHPELCDDRVTRGKPPRPRWRHELRFALEELKEEGFLERIPDPPRKSGRWAPVLRTDQKAPPS